MTKPRLEPDERPGMGNAATEPQWKEDFPIDWANDHFIARREFTKFMVVSSLGLFLGNGYLAVRGTAAGGAEPMAEQMIALVEEVQVGSARLFTYPGEADRCLLIRLAPDRFVAYSQKCTHLSCAVQYRPEPGDLFCPCHAGFFDPTSGDPTGGPPTRRLPRITLRIADGRIYATGVEV